MSVINTNYLSLVAQNNLSKSQSALGTAIERLSSGLRINSAKDDAAGQSIANRMNAQVQGLNQAARNANDGISAAQTTEGALNQINDNLNRIRVLTVQAENGTNNENDLNSIQNEITERLTEIDRISTETAFNGTRVLGIGGKLSIQVGANDNQRIDIDMQKIDVEELGLTGFNVNNAGATPNTAAGRNDILGAGFEQVGTTNEYSRDTTTTNNALTASGALDRAIAAGGDFTGGKALTIDTSNTASATGFGVDFNDGAVGDLVYGVGSDSFTYSINGGVGAGALGATDVSTKLTELASEGSGSVSATITLGGKSTEVILSGSGAITNTNNEALYLDEQGNITTTTTGTNAALTIDNLAAVLNSADGDTGAGAVITGQTYGGLALTAFSTASISVEGGPTFTAGADAAQGGVNVTGIEVSRERAAEIFGQGNGNTIAMTGFTLAVDDGAGTGATVAETTFTFNSATGALTGTTGALAGVSVNVSRSGDLTVAASTTTTETLFVQDGENNVTDATGRRVYMEQDGSDITFEAETAGTRNANPLGLLDKAIAQVDGFRSNLGAIQNRFESAIENLTTTATNLAAAQSRIQDADYAVEVANMTRAQILQQAGTSVLAQANQIPQGVLSLLR